MNTETVLLIEDSERLRRTLLRALSLEGFRTLEAGDGTAGLALARRECPDLIICDIMMPGADGYTVLTALRNEPATAGIPFIFLTAKDQHEDLRAGMNLGASDYLTKPVNLRELLAAVRARLALRRRSDAAFDLDTASPLPLESLGLTPREAESLFWATRGKNSPEIAAILGIAAPTVRKHFEHILDKLGVDNRYAAMLIALDCLRGRRSPAGAAST